MASRSAEHRKRAILKDLRNARRALLAAARGLPPPKRGQIFLGIWSPRHLIAHLVGWDSANIKASAELLAGKLPSFYRHYDRDWVL